VNETRTFRIDTTTPGYPGRVARETIRDWVRSLERTEPTEQWTILCFFAGRAVAIDENELNAAVRRAELLLAAGGDPHRPLDPFGRAATALADDLDAPERRVALRTGLEALRGEVAGLRGARESLGVLLSDEDLAWKAFATSLLAEALAEE
jgi:hypothetical protein